MNDILSNTDNDRNRDPIIILSDKNNRLTCEQFWLYSRRRALITRRDPEKDKPKIVNDVESLRNLIAHSYGINPGNVDDQMIYMFLSGVILYYLASSGLPQLRFANILQGSNSGPYKESSGRYYALKNLLWSMFSIFQSVMLITESEPLEGFDDIFVFES